MIYPSEATKDPADIVTLSFDLEPTIPDGVTITTASAAITELSGTDLSSSMIEAQAYATNTLSVTIKGGQADHKYILKITINYSDGQKQVHRLNLNVREEE